MIGSKDYFGSKKLTETLNVTLAHRQPGSTFKPFVRQGITHGDLYGHNILLNEHGDCLLGDFGAASFHATTDTLETRALQRIEVRAFGVLLGELLARIDSGLSDERRAVLEELERRCCQADVLARPGFSEVIEVLAKQLTAARSIAAARSTVSESFTMCASATGGSEPARDEALTDTTNQPARPTNMSCTSSWLSRPSRNASTSAICSSLKPLTGFFGW